MIPPGSPPAGTTNASPERNVLPDSGPAGRRVSHVEVPTLKLVVGCVTDASLKVICAFGTARLKLVLLAVNWMVWPVKKIVVSAEPTPLGFTTLLNQTKLPALMAVPLKFELIDASAPQGTEVAVAVMVGVCVAVAVGVVVAVAVAVGVAVGVAVFVGVAVGVLVGVAVGVLVGVEVAVAVGVDVGVPVGVLVAVFVGVAVGVVVAVCVGVAVGVAVAVLVGVAVGV